MCDWLTTFESMDILIKINSYNAENIFQNIWEGKIKLLIHVLYWYWCHFKGTGIVSFFKMIPSPNMYAPLYGGNAFIYVKENTKFRHQVTFYVFLK